MPKRPQGVQLAVLLMAAMLVMSLAVAWTTPLPRGTDFVLSTNTGLGAAILAVIEVGILIAFWNGMEWARVLVIVFSAFAVLNGVGVYFAWDFDRPLAVLLLCKAVTGVGFLIYLSQRAPRRWFAEMTRLNKEHAHGRSAK